MNLEKRREQLVSEVGVIFEQQGKSSVSGRIFGLLLTSTKAALTFDEIVHQLQLSKSAVSTGINLLINTRHVDYIKKTGDRKRYFKLSGIELEDVYKDFSENILKFQSALMKIDELNNIEPTPNSSEVEKMIIGIQIFKEFLPKMMEEFKKRTQ